MYENPLDGDDVATTEDEMPPAETTDPSFVTDNPLVDNAGVPPAASETAVEGGQATPALSHDITDWVEVAKWAGKLDEEAIDTVEERTALGINWEDGLTYEEAKALLGDQLTREAFDMFDAAGEIRAGAQKDGIITLEDMQNFKAKHFDEVAAGLPEEKTQALLLRYIKAKKFHTIHPDQAASMFREKFTSDSQLYVDGKINVARLLEGYTSEKLRALVEYILAEGLNIQVKSGDEYDDTLTITEEQLKIIFAVVEFMARIENPSEITSAASGISKMDEDDDTAEDFLAYYTKGTSNEVEQAEETSSSEQSQQTRDDDLPAELREGMKQLYVYADGKFTTGGANNDQPVPRAEITDADYLDAIGHFKAVINNSSIGIEFRRRAYAYIMQCYASLIERAPSYDKAKDLIKEAVAILNTGDARTVLGTSTVIGQLINFAQMAMEPNLMYKGVSVDGKLERRLGAEEFAYGIYSLAEQNINSATTLGTAEKNQLKAQLAEMLARMYHLSYRQHAVEVAQTIQGEVRVPKINRATGEVERDAQGQMLTTPMAAEEFLSNIRSMAETHPAIAEGMTMIFVASPDGQGSTLTSDAEKLMAAIGIFKAVLEDEENSTDIDRAKSAYWQAICEMTLASIAWENGVRNATTIAQFKEAAELFNQASDQFKSLIAGLVEENPYDTRIAELSSLREGALAQIVRIAYTLIKANVNGSRAVGKDIAKLLDATDDTTQIRLGENLVMTPEKARQMLLGNNPNMNIQAAITQQGISILASGQPQQGGGGEGHHSNGGVANASGSEGGTPNPNTQWGE